MEDKRKQNTKQIHTLFEPKQLNIKQISDSFDRNWLRPQESINNYNSNRVVDLSRDASPNLSLNQTDISGIGYSSQFDITRPSGLTPFMKNTNNSQAKFEQFIKNKIDKDLQHQNTTPNNNNSSVIKEALNGVKNQKYTKAQLELLFKDLSMSDEMLKKFKNVIKKELGQRKAASKQREGSEGRYNKKKSISAMTSSTHASSQLKLKRFSSDDESLTKQHQSRLQKLKEMQIKILNNNDQPSENPKITNQESNNQTQKNTIMTKLEDFKFVNIPEKDEILQSELKTSFFSRDDEMSVTNKFNNIRKLYQQNNRPKTAVKNPYQQTISKSVLHSPSSTSYLLTKPLNKFININEYSQKDIIMPTVDSKYKDPQINEQNVINFDRTTILTKQRTATQMLMRNTDEMFKQYKQKDKEMDQAIEAQLKKVIPLAPKTFVTGQKFVSHSEVPSPKQSYNSTQPINSTQQQFSNKARRVLVKLKDKRHSSQDLQLILGDESFNNREIIGSNLHNKSGDGTNDITHNIKYNPILNIFIPNYGQQQDQQNSQRKTSQTKKNHIKKRQIKTPTGYRVKILQGSAMNSNRKISSQLNSRREHNANRSLDSIIGIT